MDLWPEDLKIDMRSPTTLLNEQASLLGQRTGNLILAEVEDGFISEIMMHRIKLRMDLDDLKHEKFAYNFNIIAPALRNYKYRLFSIVFGIDLYPTEFYLDDDIKNELHLEDRIPVASSEEEFIELLTNIFKSKKCKKVISALIAQSTGT